MLFGLMHAGMQHEPVLNGEIDRTSGEATPNNGRMGSGAGSFNPLWLMLALAPLTAVAVWWASRLGVIRPKVVEPDQQSQRHVMLPMLLGLGVLLGGTIAAQIGLYSAQISAASSAAPADLTTQTRIASVTYALALIAALGAWWYLRGSDARVSPRTSAARGLAGGFAGFGLALPVIALAMLLGQALTILIMGAPAPTLAHVTLAAIVDPSAPVWAKIVMIAAVVIAAPIVEEILYRGCAQTALVRATGSAWTGILLSGVIFVLVHAASVPREAWLGAGLTLATLSIALGLAFARTGRIVTPIVIHACFNAANVAGALATM